VPGQPREVTTSCGGTEASRLENATAVELVSSIAMLSKPLPFISEETPTEVSVLLENPPDEPTDAEPIGGALFQVMADSLHEVSATGQTVYPVLDEDVASTFRVRPSIVPGTELRSNFR